MNKLPDLFTPFLNQLPMPPAWLIAEGHNRIVLLLNHILQQEPEAMQRLSRQKGRIVQFMWQKYALQLTATPVGLLAVASEGADGASPKVDLVLEITDTDVQEIGKKWLQGGKPNVRIEGDVQLAAEVQWLTQNVVWDLEDDIARWVGNIPAHHIAQTVRAVQTKLKEWVSTR